MYRFDDVGSTILSLPPNLQTTENDCFGYALDRQMRKMYALAKQITVWSDLDNVSPRYYDALAMTIRAPYYKSEYSNEQKLGLIKSALLTRRQAGTIRAIEELMSHTLTGAVFIPWYKYGGKPYYFKVMADADEIENANMKEFIRMISSVKSARSCFGGIGLKTDIDNSALNGLRLYNIRMAMRMPFYPFFAYDGHLRYDGAARYDAKRGYKLGVGFKVRCEIPAPQQKIGSLAVISRRNVLYYNGEKRYDGTTKFNALLRRDEIE